MYILSVDGGWSPWTSSGGCSTTCGPDGLQLRIRDCSLPPPQHNGKECQGPSNDTVPCNRKECSKPGQSTPNVKCILLWRRNACGLIVSCKIY